MTLEHSALGKSTTYITEYNRELLFPIPRKQNRHEIGISNALPFYGVDVWNAYELSWLNPNGKPMVALAEFIFPCESTHLIESKSFKLYLNSFNNTAFLSWEDVRRTLRQDLSQAAGGNVSVKICLLEKYPENHLHHFSGIYLDHLDVECNVYQVEPLFLSIENEIISETVYSNLLKSNCPVTGQPDWASIEIIYTGKRINHAGLLKYIVSFRNHNEFHEQCVERIFVDIMQRCKPQKLSIQARYTRRGGLDINPFRSTEKIIPANDRLIRQ